MFCFINDCKLSRTLRKVSQKDPYLSTFIKFPKEETLFKKWLKALGVQNDSAIKWNDNMYLCSGHFKDEDYIEKQVGDNKVVIQLKKDTVPSYIPPPPPIFKPKNLPKTNTNAQSVILKRALMRPLNNKTKPDEELNEVVDNANKKREGANKTESTNSTKPYTKRLYYQPRFLKDVQLSDLENPTHAKVCLNIAKRTLSNQTKRIQLLKNQNRALYKRLDKLQQILNYMARVEKQRQGKQGDIRETITVLVNI